ncbi:proteasome assembly chaperone 4 [Sabethes cyaneus]|uniref:proteasome assembly chaperone 4 n=1 Tax=Sabethes cyaneus TaxID=53552 RepID=UPI00237D660E|nr:proteasome assembly chaperone 4 [Sabethes cyaneus]
MRREKPFPDNKTQQPLQAGQQQRDITPITRRVYRAARPVTFAIRTQSNASGAVFNGNRTATGALDVFGFGLCSFFAMTSAIPSNFTTHLCSVEVCDNSYNVRVLKMNNSVFIYIGENNAENFDELAMAMPMSADSEILTTSILGSLVGCGSEELAQKLARKLKKQVYVSVNVPNDRIIRPAIERKLFEEIRNNMACF